MVKSSGVPGVTWQVAGNMWVAYIHYLGEPVYLGSGSNKRYVVELRKAAERKIREFNKEISKIEANQMKRLRQTKKKSSSAKVRAENIDRMPT